MHEDVPLLEKPGEIGPDLVGGWHDRCRRPTSDLHGPAVHHVLEVGEERPVHQPRKDTINVADAAHRKLVRHKFTERNFFADQCSRERKVDLERTLHQVRTARRVGIAGVYYLRSPVSREDLEDRHQPDHDELVRDSKSCAIPTSHERRDLAHASRVPEPLAAHPDARDLGKLVPCHSLKVMPAALGHQLFSLIRSVMENPRRSSRRTVMNECPMLRRRMGVLNVGLWVLPDATILRRHL